MSGIRSRRASAIAAAVLVLSVSAGRDVDAAEGAIEINQTSVIEAGGFPYSLSQPGLYILTGNLNAVGTSGFDADTPGVTVDFRGFTLSGTGTGTGIEIQAEFVTLRNGRVDGFQMGLEAESNLTRLERMTFSNNLFEGAILGESGLVSGCVFVGNGAQGLSAPSSTGFSDSVFADNAGENVQGATALSRSVCDGVVCRSTHLRRYYLTQQVMTGTDPDEPGVCAPGFHFASVHELLVEGSLAYDGSLGFTVSSGEGPTIGAGWVRNGVSDCSNWSNSTSGAAGTALHLAYPVSLDGSATNVSPFHAPYSNTCSVPVRAWCIEDVN